MATSEPASSTAPVSVSLTIAPPPDDAVVYSPPPPYEARDEQDSSPGKETGKLFLSSEAKGFLLVLFFWIGGPKPFIYLLLFIVNILMGARSAVYAFLCTTLKECGGELTLAERFVQG